MKITRAQKDAVLDLLREKFDEKEVKVFNKFKEDNKENIQTKYAKLIERYNKLLQLKAVIGEEIKTFNVIRKTFEELDSDYHFNGSDVTGYYKSEDKFIDALLKLNFTRLKRPDFIKVERQLELDTLSKDFNLDAFIDKYLSEE